MINALLGPVLAAIAAALGRMLGASLGVLVAALVLSALALALAVAIARWRRSVRMGIAAAALWLFVSGMNADLGHAVALLESGAHVTGARLADTAGWRGQERVTFVDGALRSDLRARADHEVDDGGKGVHTHHRVWCAATPLVAAAWTSATEVRFWALEDRVTSQPLARQAFRPITAPDDDCRRAIASALRDHQLTPAVDPIYLERLESSAAPDALAFNGLMTAIVLGATWLLGLGWRGGRRALAMTRARRRSSSAMRT